MKWTSLFALLFTLSLVVEPAGAKQYFVAPNGDDRASGTTPKQAWYSPSRGQPTRIRATCKPGSKTLLVYSTSGFLKRGKVRVGNRQIAYRARTATTFELVKPLPTAVPLNALVYDAAILDGRSFQPGDVINLVGGIYVNRPLNFCQSGSAKRPITYRSATKQRAVLVSTRFDLSPIRHLGNRRSKRTRFVQIENLTIRNSTDGNHGAPGINLFGVSHVVVRGCHVDISGRDINGDNNALQLFDADHVLIDQCRLRSRYANGVAAWATTNVDLSRCLIFESFHGVTAAGGRYKTDLRIRNCTIYATNQHGGVHAESPSRVTVNNTIIAQMPSADMEALRRGSGDYNLLWHVAKRYGKSWNSQAAKPPEQRQGRAGKNDRLVDPQFLSFDPASPHFLRFTGTSPAASMRKDGGHVGAFPPITQPAAPAPRILNVRDFGALGDGVTDDTKAIRAALAAAHPGTRIVFPRTKAHYLISDTLRLSQSGVQLVGNGSKVRLKAQSGRMHLIEIRGKGPTTGIVENVTIDGFHLDGNYRKQPRSRVGHPRGVWVEQAAKVSLKNMSIRNVYGGVTFARDTRNCLALNIRVIDWDHDGFGASGWGKNGGCTDIRFIRCTAKDARCVKAWEIEEGAQRVRLEDCQVENLTGTGTGFYVRHHAYRWPLLVDDVTFFRCTARNLSGTGFLITTVPGQAIRPYIRTRNIQLLQCKSNAPVTIACGVERVQILGGAFAGPVGLGFNGNGKNKRVGPKWPVHSVRMDGSQISRLKINARTGNPTNRLGDQRYPDYVPQIHLQNVRLAHPPQVIGNRKLIKINSTQGK